MSKKFHSALCILGLGACFNVHSLDESRLWLPKRYEKLYLDLRDSARAAENLERCVMVLRGTLDLEKSTDQHPIFRIQCRQANGRTYNESVDGLSKETLTTKIEVPVALTEEELEMQRLEAQREHEKAMEALKLSYLNQCSSVFNEKTKLFNQLERVNEGDELLEFEESGAFFRFDFNALDVDGEILKYRASCWADEGEKVEIKFKKRRQTENR